MSTCRALKLKTVAIYTPEDKLAPHVYAADEAHQITSYLNEDEIIAIAKESKTCAIHPGYGFLSENDKFASKVIKNSLVWIGPSPKSIKMLGNKIEARKAMEELKVPIVPGFNFNDLSNASRYKAKNIANQIGYPVILKAALGGGGRAIQKITSETEFDEFCDKVIRENKKLFNSEELCMEKYITFGRHVEIQIASDGFNAIHLYERECSIQRRHQKLIEESPCRFVSRQTLQKMYALSTKIAKELKYRSLGTIEFIVTPQEEFYFLEMNTRVQVEHTVTEAVTGIDMIWLQLMIANTHKLPITQGDVQQRGHAIECRIIAEDPNENFMPSCGTMHNVRLPNGPFIRHDHAIEEGLKISPLFDSMISKLISHGYTRELATSYMTTALGEFSICGIKNNISFMKKILESEAFRSGTFYTQWLEKNLNKFIDQEEHDELALISAAIAEKPKKSTTRDINKTSLDMWKKKSWQ